MTESTAAPEPSLSALYQAHRDRLHGWLQRRLGYASITARLRVSERSDRAYEHCLLVGL